MLRGSFVSGVAELGLGVSTQTITLMTTMMAGAGIDYAVFLLSRYHDYLRQGLSSDEAVATALTSIGKVIAGSAATVSVTFLGMIFTHLGAFRNIGPALAISIAVALIAAVTFLPALMVLTGRRGWIKPRRDITSRFWRITGMRIVRKPVIHLAGSLTVLLILAGCSLFARFNYDDSKTLPTDVESSVGYDTLAQHFPLNATIPEYLVVHSDQDLRKPARPRRAEADGAAGRPNARYRGDPSRPGAVGQIGRQEARRGRRPAGHDRQGGQDL